jgi:SpoIIAA-like
MRFTAIDCGVSSDESTWVTPSGLSKGVVLLPRRLRLLYRFGPSFNRITAGALWADSRLGARYLPLMDGCALVTDIDWIQAPGRGIATWLPCPMRVYDNAHRDDAACWLEGLTAGVHPSVAQTAKAYIGGTGGATFSIAKLLLSRRFRRSDR